MSRLLFAAARGARIQINGFTATVPGWYDSRKWSSMHESVLRIHPDDEHLQYGPISTALRDRAKTASASIYLTTEGYTMSGAVIDAMTWHYTRRYYEANELHRALFLLILAEALADEGL